MLDRTTSVARRFDFDRLPQHHKDGPRPWALLEGFQVGSNALNSVI